MMRESGGERASHPCGGPGRRPEWCPRRSSRGRPPRAAPDGVLAMRRGVFAVGVAVVVLAPAVGAGQPVGAFEGHGDVGAVLHPGSASFDAAGRTYTVAGSGENMWFTRDAFHFVWKRVAGDVALAADVAFLGAGKNPHRKACLMIR